MQCSDDSHVPNAEVTQRESVWINYPTSFTGYSQVASNVIATALINLL